MRLAKPSEREKLIMKIGVVMLGAICVAGLALRGVDLRSWFERGMTFIRGAGPWPFFLGMAFLPAVAFPMSVFTLTAGPAFAASMGAPAAVAAANAAVTANLVLTYWLSRWALRPWLARLLQRLGYRLPEIGEGDIADLIVLLRVTPGVPFFAQNYLLGLANAPLAKYLLISCAIAWTYTTSLVLFGDALLHGKGGLAVGALSVLVAFMAAMHIVRRHYAGRKGTT